MKKVILALAVGIGALALTACQSTSNSPTPAAAATVCTNGTQVINGQVVQCNAGGYGYTTGVGGMPTPYGGTVGSVGGCSYWTQYYAAYGAYYVPMVDPMSGQLECVNVGSSGYSQLSSYGYTGQTPIYGCSSYNQSACYGYGNANYYGNGGYYNQGYGQGLGICIGGGDDSGYGAICL